MKELSDAIKGKVLESISIEVIDGEPALVIVFTDKTSVNIPGSYTDEKRIN